MLDFNSLPSAQGWTYFSGVPGSESTVFSLAGGVLSMDSACCNAAYYKLEGSVDPNLPFSLKATARVFSGGHALAFYVAAGGVFAAINLSPVGVLDEVTGAMIGLSANGTFHDFEMRGSLTLGYDVFIDNVLLGSGSIGAYGPNLLLLGDSGSFGSGQAEITAFSFVQVAAVPEPEMLTLFLVGFVALMVAGSRRRKLSD